MHEFGSPGSQTTSAALQVGGSEARPQHPCPMSVQPVSHCESLALGLSDALSLRYFTHDYEAARATAVS